MTLAPVEWITTTRPSSNLYSATRCDTRTGCPGRRVQHICQLRAGDDGEADHDLPDAGAQASHGLAAGHPADDRSEEYGRWPSGLPLQWSARHGWTAASLSLEERQALILRYGADLPDDESGVLQGVTDRAVRYRCERAIGKIASFLNGYEGLDSSA